MEKIKRISHKNLPVKIPVTSTAVIYLYLDKYNAPGWLWGVVVTLIVIVLILTISIIYKEDKVDIFKEDE